MGAARPSSYNIVENSPRIASDLKVPAWETFAAAEVVVGRLSAFHLNAGCLNADIWTQGMFERETFERRAHLNARLLNAKMFERKTFERKSKNFLVSSSYQLGIMFVKIERKRGA